MAATTAQTENAPAEAEKPAEAKAESRKSTARKAAEVASEVATERTTLDQHLDAPSVTVPGDGPADTLDPLERASSATPDKGAAAMAGHQTVNAVVPVPEREIVAGVPEPGPDRVEEYDVVNPAGKRVHVSRNIETGVSTATAAD